MPKGICSWGFFLDGDGHHAALEFDWLGEQGSIAADGTPLLVRKHGVLSGHWTLERAGREVVASGKKSTALTRTFDIQGREETLVLCAESPFGRSFRVERSGDVIATMCPDHAFTRRATIRTLAKELDFSTLCFSFWLVVLMWRRAAQSSSGGGGG